MAQKILTLSAGGAITEIDDAYQGTVTSVAALTLGTTGTNLSSTVAGGTGAAVITLNVPTASAANRGALSAADWSTFSAKFASTGGVIVNPGAITTVTIGAGAAGENARFILRGNATQNAWRVAASETTASALEFAYSTAGGGITFTNTMLIMTPSGIGFQGSAALAKPTITGSRAGNAALASLLTALASYGLITDSTTA